MYEEEPLDGTIVAIQGFLNILEALRKTGAKNLVHPSTSAVYEGNPVPYLEDMELRPPDLKALSKKVNEEMAWQYSSRYGIKAIGLRPFSVYGPNEFSKGRLREHHFPLRLGNAGGKGASRLGRWKSDQRFHLCRGCGQSVQTSNGGRP
jgi:nucleoside-diphosphate-sugar epimerase